MTEMDQFLKEFGKALKTTRKQMGLSQVTAAQNMRIDYRHYQNIEGGKINLRLDTLIKLVKFYNLDTATRPFNVDACLDLLAGFKDSNAHDSWPSICHHFVDGGHAGFVTVNVRTKSLEEINEKLLRTLGYDSPAEVVGKPIQSLLVNESGMQLDELLAHHVADQVSKPFIVSFRTKSQTHVIPMMAVVKSKKDVLGQDEMLHCIFFDRKTLDEEGHRLKDILNGYQQFMELYPQLKAV